MSECVFTCLDAIIDGMANKDATPEETVEAGVEGRANLSTGEYMTAVLTYITGGTPTAGAVAGPQVMAIYTANPGTTGTGGIPATGRPTVAWNVAASTGVAAISASGTATFTNVPPGTYQWYGVFNAAGAFLYGKSMPTVTVPAGATGTVNVTATHTYDIN